MTAGPTAPSIPLFRKGSCMAEAPVVALNGVNKWFGTFHALKDITLAVRPGALGATRSRKKPEPDG